MRSALIYSISCIALTSFALSSFGDIIYVDAEANGLNDGQSWENAYENLQFALDRALADDDIWIAEGTYHPSQNGNRGESFVLKAGVSLIGGFRGGETSKNDRNPAAYPTTLSGNIGSAQLTTDNSYRVCVAVDLNPPPLLEGLVICDAFNERESIEGRGGGLYIVSTSLTISNCTIRDNYAGGGAGLWNEAASSRITRCTFRCNENNGITNWGGESPTIVECLFDENRTSGRGAAYNAWTFYHYTQFIGCTFENNRSGSLGGVYYGVGHPTFEGCLFLRNKAGSAGGIAYLHEGLSTFTNCVGYDNYSDFHAGGVQTHTDDSVLAVTNCIFWGNTSKHTTGERNQINPRGEGQLNYCCVEGWTGEFGGVGNFGDDPRFIDPERGNLRLREDSPCYDAGDDTAVTQKVDLDGHPRILGDRVDLGSYELLCPAILSLKASCTTGGKLKAVVRTTLPEGATVRVRQGEGKSREATVKPNGKAVAKWRPDETDTGSICPEGCTDPLCAEPPCP